MVNSEKNQPLGFELSLSSDLVSVEGAYECEVGAKAIGGAVAIASGSVIIGPGVNDDSYITHIRWCSDDSYANVLI